MLMPTVSLINVTIEAFQPILYLVMQLSHLVHSWKLDVVMVFLPPAQGTQLTHVVYVKVIILHCVHFIVLHHTHATSVGLQHCIICTSHL